MKYENRQTWAMALFVNQKNRGGKRTRPTLYPRQRDFLLAWVFLRGKEGVGHLMKTARQYAPFENIFQKRKLIFRNPKGCTCP